MASLNEAEKVADRDWEAARTHMERSKAPDSLFAKCVDFVMYVGMRTATTASRHWKTPYEMMRGVKPDVSKLHRWYTVVNVTVPKSKRAALAKKGLHHLRGEPGRVSVFQSLLSTTYADMLDGDVEHSVATNRLVHSVNVVFDDANFTSSLGPDLAPDVVNHFHMPIPAGSPPEEANRDKVSEVDDAANNPVSNPLCEWPDI